MCANYTPVTRADRLLQYFGVQRGRDEPDHDTFPMGLAPFIRLAPSNTNPGEMIRNACVIANLTDLFERSIRPA